MSCYHPLRLFRSGVVNPESGKEFTLVTSHGLDYVTAQDFDKRFIVHNLKPSERRFEYQEIPCGVCVGCRSDWSARWTARSLAELLDHDVSLFITLTYDDNHLPEDRLLRKDDIQRFNKRLRKAGFKFRYLICGEYGDRFQRPHYHGIYFGLKLDDLLAFSDTKAGKLFVSDTLSRIWGNGFVTVGNVDLASIAYVTRYVLKKRGQWSEEKPPFFLMSRRPSIGANFYERDIHDGRYTLASGNGSFVVSGLPRYLRLKYNIESGNADDLKKQEFSSCKSSGFDDITSYREYLEWLDYNPLNNR